MSMAHYIEVDSGINLFVEDWGQGKPIVFIAGWPFDHRCYEYQFNEIPKHGFRCIGINMRGYGKSDRPWQDLNYDIFADDILKVLKKLNIENATLVGHSMGGAISMHYVAKHSGHRISKLVLCGAAAPVWTQRSDYIYGFSKAEVDELITLCYTDRAQLLLNFGKLFFYTESSLSAPLMHWFSHIAMEASPHATVSCLYALRDTDLRSDMPKITIPTAIFHGTADKVCPFEFAKLLQAGIKNTLLVPFEKSGHGLFYDEREKFNKSLMDFAR